MSFNWTGVKKPAYSHPHPNPEHVMRAYRQHILGTKKNKGTARNLGHYRAYVSEYLAAKREFFRRSKA